MRFISTFFMLVFACASQSAWAYSCDVSIKISYTEETSKGVFRSPAEFPIVSLSFSESGMVDWIDTNILPSQTEKCGKEAFKRYFGVGWPEDLSEQQVSAMLTSASMNQLTKDRLCRPGRAVDLPLYKVPVWAIKDSYFYINVGIRKINGGGTENSTGKLYVPRSWCQVNQTSSSNTPSPIVAPVDNRVPCATCLYDFDNKYTACMKKLMPNGITPSLFADSASEAVCMVRSKNLQRLYSDGMDGVGVEELDLDNLPRYRPARVILKK